MTLNEPGPIAMSPTVATQPGKSQRHDLAHAEHECRRPECSIAPRVHRRRAGMPRLALEGDEERARADDPGDDADIDTGPLEHRPLLDVELEKPRERGRAAARRRTPDSVIPIRSSSVTRSSRVPRGALEHLRREPAGERPAPERADECALLVGEVDCLEHDRQSETRILHGTKHLERAEHPERAVVPPCPSHRIQVRPEQERRRGGRTSRQDRGVVRRRVDPGLEPGRARTIEEPRAGADVRVRECRPADPSASMAPNAPSASKSARNRSGFTRSGIGSMLQRQSQASSTRQRRRSVPQSRYRDDTVP